MKITETFFGGEDYMYEGGLDITLHTNSYKKTITFKNGEAEDFCLARDLSDASYVATLLIEAYEAGKRGEDLEIETHSDFLEDEE